MLAKLFRLQSPGKILELENLERMLQASLPEIEPRSDYESNLRRRLSDYSHSMPKVQPRPRPRFNSSTNDALLLIISLLSGAIVLAMGIRVAILTIAGLGLIRNMKQDIQSGRWQSPHIAG